MDYRKKGTDKEIFDRYKEQISKGKYSVYLVERNDYLIKKGLFKLVESNQEDKDSYIDDEDQKYWKKVPLDITHEEYMYIQKLHGEIKEHKTRASGIFILGLIIIAIGIGLGIEASTLSIIEKGTAQIIAVCTFLFGFLCIALGIITGEIKKIYDAIRDLK